MVPATPQARGAPLASPVVEGPEVTFSLSDRHGRLAAVRLLDEIGLRGPTDMTRSQGLWRLRMPVPEVNRMEYLYELEDHNGRRSTITDPGNPRRVCGAFGDKSEAVFPGYVEPGWLGWPEPAHVESPVEFTAPALDSEVTGSLWHPAALPARQPAPLLVVHDGPEYATLGSFTKYLGAAIAAGLLPPLRAALLGPGDRNVWYSANPAYAEALCRDVLPELDAIAPATVRIGIGISLGGLAMLHAHRSFPRLFDGLLLQSASFFTPKLDPQERGFPGFQAVTAFVAGLRSATADPDPIPIVLTCGTPEENLTNNRAMAADLRRLGYPTEMIELRDAHNYIAWRDALNPHLTRLVTELESDRAA